MYTFQHYKFITTPLSKILEDGVNASRGIGSGIETYPLCDYIMQSIFLKMTGAQEQKMKCICWEMATNDYEYRREYLGNAKKDYGEFSKYDQKNKVYKRLLAQIKQIDREFDFDKFCWIKPNKENVDILVEMKVKQTIVIQQKQGKKVPSIQGREKMRDSFRSRIQKQLNNEESTNKDLFALILTQLLINTLRNTSLSIWQYNGFSTFIKNAFFTEKNFATQSSILKNELKKIYIEDVITHRHRCAHNLTSYQQDLPTLSTLANPDYIYRNYFFRFAILILIDEIFICLYKKYVEALENNINW